ncbi:MFS transporter [Arthrobacter sp. ISL-48]|uniref:MFS transporter n=1 Tax=Arthrobacter sp. ISL-48 TaxID=2819110 RepID=UPI001BEB0394|nr:MFS transporter [Arthrobacter sp. ISL-48]MBT2533961.1 MFS transporter [Arthrobacter sp. ISL-48]
MMITRRVRVGLLMLALAAFGYNTSESFPVGLLPRMSADLQVAESQIGALLTLYAAVVAVTVIPVVVMTSSIGRRRLILVTVAALAVSNVAISVAPTYELLLGARLLSATTHGIFWSMIAPTAALLVPRGREGYATAIAFTGSSLAMVAGTPLVTALGELIGWRLAAALLAFLAIVTFIGLRAALPALGSTTLDRGHRAQWEPFVRTIKDGTLIALCVGTVLVVVAYFATYTYIAVFLERYAGVTGTALSMVLLAFGLAGLVGVSIVGKVTDRRPRLAAVVCLATLAAALFGMAVFADVAPVAVIVSVVALGGAFAAVPVCLQSAVIRVAPGSADVASSVYVVAFQIGIAGGSLIGGWMIDRDQLAMVPVWAGIIALFAGFIVIRLRRAFTPLSLEPAASPVPELVDRA